MTSRSNLSRASRGKVGGKASTAPCACCGISPDPNGRPFSIVFEQPDVIFDINPNLLDTWGEDPFLAIKNVGFFLRVILPVTLADGFAIEFGTWLEVDAIDFREAWRIWNAPEYAAFEIDGYIANEIEPWKPFPHAMVHAVVRDENQVPYIAASEHERFAQILNGEWSHAEALTPYTALLKTEPPTQS